MLAAEVEEEQDLAVLVAEVEEMLRMEMDQTMGMMRMETTLVIKVTEEMDQTMALATGAPRSICPIGRRMETPTLTMDQMPLVL